MCTVPDIDGESVVVDQQALIWSFQGDGGFGSSAHFTTQDHSFSQSTRDVSKRGQKLWSHFITEKRPHVYIVKYSFIISVEKPQQL